MFSLVSPVKIPNTFTTNVYKRPAQRFQRPRVPIGSRLINYSKRIKNRRHVVVHQQNHSPDTLSGSIIYAHVPVVESEGPYVISPNKSLTETDLKKKILVYQKQRTEGIYIYICTYTCRYYYFDCLCGWRLDFIVYDGRNARFKAEVLFANSRIRFGVPNEYYWTS